MTEPVARAARLAALYDVHGNLPALRAVLDEVRTAAVERIVVGGDVVPGPMPAETVDELLSLEIPIDFIQGNGDREVIAWSHGVETGHVPERFREVLDWTARQLSPAHYETLAGWPATIRVDVEGIGIVLFCHATPRSDTEIFTRLTPDDRLVPLFERRDARLIVCGHTHMQFDRTVGGMRILNAGSVGMPFGDPGADWLLLGPDIQLMHTEYDLASAAELIRATAYPQADEFADRNVLRPPSEAEMLEVFGGANR